ncbi:MAG: FtsX-like permease family protein [Acidobacteria bacterium]|nr:MAG: FtsX-like permease family protein [Acidobacteriota bacterium]
MAYSRTRRDAPWLRVVGRLGPEVSTERARAETAALASQLRAENPSANRGRSLQVVPLDRWRTADMRQLLLMLSLAAGLAFLVAVANAAGLMMTDSLKRQPELAIRQALGAGPAQLLRVVLVRSVLWSLPGAVLGYVFGVATLAFVRWGASAGTESLGTVPVGPVVIAAGLGLTLLGGLATGAVAAWTLRHRDLVQSLHEAGLAVSTGRRRRRATLVLVAAQVAVATGLAIGSALLVRSMWNVAQADRGFDLDRGLVVQVRLPRSHYPRAAEQATYYQQALARVRALPGVLSAGVSASPPLTNTTVMLSGSLKVESPSGDSTLNRMLGQFVTAGYFEAAGLRLIKGRFFSEQDEQSAAPNIVVDEAFCRAHLKGADPLAYALHLGRDRLAIVGVVGDVRQDTERQSARAVQYQNRGVAYMLFRRFNGSPTWSFMVVRASVNPATLGEATVRELMAVDHLACLDDPRTFAQLFAARIAERQRILGLLGSLAAIVLVLTALSMAAALAQFVAVHERDLAIRLAVGATRRHVVLLTSRAVASALGLGLALGAFGGLALARTLESQLYQVEPTDATTIMGTMVLLLALAGAAAAGPVWRASRIDPTTTLRAL